MSPRARRLHPRWCLHASVDVVSADGSWAGLSYDVSAGGIFVATDAAPAVGTNVAVNVTLPDGTRLELAGQVRWHRDGRRARAGLPAGVGIEWSLLPAEALRHLLHFAELEEPLAGELDEPLVAEG